MKECITIDGRDYMSFRESLRSILVRSIDDGGLRLILISKEIRTLKKEIRSFDHPLDVDTTIVML